jgi:LPXTG-motif cell wall-anchored protein
VTARATLPGTLPIDVADCIAAPGEGTGLLNTATVTYTDGQADASACAAVPASLPPTGAMVVGLWLGLGLLLSGAVLFLLRRRNRRA